jgi:hypothetical protein
MKRFVESVFTFDFLVLLSMFSSAITFIIQISSITVNNDLAAFIYTLTAIFIFLHFINKIYKKQRLDRNYPYETYDELIGNSTILITYKLKWWQSALFDTAYKTKFFDNRKDAEEYFQSLIAKGIKSIHWFEKYLSTNYPVKQ